MGTKKDETERVTGLGRRTRDEIAKWNQMTALGFQTGGRHQTSPASTSERGAVYRMRRTDAMTDPCGTPQLMVTGAELQLFTVTV